MWKDPYQSGCLVLRRLYPPRLLGQGIPPSKGQAPIDYLRALPPPWPSPLPPPPLPPARPSPLPPPRPSPLPLPRPLPLPPPPCSGGVQAEGSVPAIAGSWMLQQSSPNEQSPVASHCLQLPRRPFQGASSRMRRRSRAASARSDSRPRAAMVALSCLSCRLSLSSTPLDRN